MIIGQIRTSKKQRLYSTTMTKIKNTVVAGLFLGLAFVAQRASAQFTVFDNFDSLTAGALDGQGGWTLGSGAGTTGISVTSGGSFGSGNYAQFNEGFGNGGNQATYKSGLGIVGTSTAATVFVQFSLPSIPSTPANVTAGNVTSMNLDVDQVSNPANAASTSSAQFNYDNNNGGGLFRIRNGGGFANAAASSGGAAITPIAGATYDLWYVINASTATYSLYLEDVSNGGTDGLTSPTLLFAGTASSLAFRTGGGGNTAGVALNTFNMGEGSATGTVPQTEVDNIFVDLNGQDLTSPIPTVPEPGTMALLGLGGAALVFGKRKRS
jgi:PEP-CTERM motif